MANSTKIYALSSRGFQWREAPPMDGMLLRVTGAAGFIGAATSHVLLERGETVIGIDNINDYYDPRLKEARLARLRETYGEQFSFERIDFADAEALRPLRKARISIASSISERRRASATVLKTPGLCEIESGRPLNMLEVAGTTACGTWSMRRLRRSMAATEFAVPCRGPGRSTPFALRCDEEIRRAAERELCQHLSPAADGPAFLHRLWPVGPAGYGDVDLR